ncbi:MAG: hypothetical protein R2792_17265 [Saprospiraceae bacterium]
MEKNFPFSVNQRISVMLDCGERILYLPEIIPCKFERTTGVILQGIEVVYEILVSGMGVANYLKPRSNFGVLLRKVQAKKKRRSVVAIPATPGISSMSFI